MQMLGCDVDIVSNGREALHRVSSNEYDLVFMDCQMPVMDGYTATELIRDQESQSGLRRTSIVALTAGTTREDRERCVAVGMDDYIAKPFSISDISDVLEKYVFNGRWRRHSAERLPMHQAVLCSSTT